jgi:hypothetical protein
LEYLGNFFRAKESSRRTITQKYDKPKDRENKSESKIMSTDPTTGTKRKNKRKIRNLLFPILSIAILSLSVEGCPFCHEPGKLDMLQEELIT